MPAEQSRWTKTIPRLDKSTRNFLLKLVVLFIAWELAYIFILKPIRIPDRQLTIFITGIVTWCINLFPGPDLSWVESHYYPACQLIRNGKPVFAIVDSCNGLDLFLIYLSIIWLLPYPAKRKLIFSIAGIIGIIIVNIIRCVALYWIYRTHPNLFEINHHYLFTILIYLFIFYGWVLFTKTGKDEKVG